MSRLFVALWPPADVVEGLEVLHRKDRPGVRFVPPENWHVTLRFLGDARVDEVAAALDDVVHERPVTVELGPAVDLLADRTLVVPASGADDLAASVVEATTGLGSAPIRRRFRGHLTLARIKRWVEPRSMPREIGSLVDATWTAHEFALVESVLRPDGARYHTVATWPVPTPIGQFRRRFDG